MSEVVNVAPANLASLFFSDLYRKMWYITLVFVVPILLYLLFKSLRRNDPDNSLGKFFQVLVAVPVLGYTVPFLLWSIQLLCFHANTLLVQLSGREPDFNFWDRFFAKQEGNELRPLLDFFNWIFAGVLSAEAFLLNNLVLVVGPIVILAVVFYLVGGIGEGVGTTILSITIVSLCSQVVILVILLFGILLLDNTTDPAHLNTGISVATTFVIGFAAASPFLLHKLVIKPMIKLGGGQSRVSGGGVKVTQQGGSNRFSTYASRSAAFAKRGATRQLGSPPALEHLNSIRTAPAGQRLPMARRITQVVTANKLVKVAATKTPATAGALALAAQLAKPRQAPRFPSRPPTNVASPTQQKESQS